MSKHVTTVELAEIVSALLVAPEAAGQLEETGAHLQFTSDIADVIANHCGGEVFDAHAATPDGMPATVSVVPSDSLPEGSEGIWLNYDTEGWEQTSPPQVRKQRYQKALIERQKLRRATNAAVLNITNRVESMEG